MRFGLVWFGLVWFGVVLCGLARSGPVWSGPVRCGAVRCGAVRCGAVRCGAVRCGAVRYGTARSFALCSVVVHAPLATSLGVIIGEQSCVHAQRRVRKYFSKYFVCKHVFFHRERGVDGFGLSSLLGASERVVLGSAARVCVCLCV